MATSAGSRSRRSRSHPSAGRTNREIQAECGRIMQMRPARIVFCLKGSRHRPPRGIRTSGRPCRLGRRSFGVLHTRIRRYDNDLAATKGTQWHPREQANNRWTAVNTRDHWAVCPGGDKEKPRGYVWQGSLRSKLWPAERFPESGRRLGQTLHPTRSLWINESRRATVRT